MWFRAYLSFTSCPGCSLQATDFTIHGCIILICKMQINPMLFDIRWHKNSCVVSDLIRLVWPSFPGVMGHHGACKNWRSPTLQQSPSPWFDVEEFLRGAAPPPNPLPTPLHETWMDFTSLNLSNCSLSLGRLPVSMASRDSLELWHHP